MTITYKVLQKTDSQNGKVTITLTGAGQPNISLVVDIADEAKYPIGANITATFQA